MHPSPEKQREMLRLMQTIRRFEERATKDYIAGDIYGVVHSYIGEEAVAVGSFRSEMAGQGVQADGFRVTIEWAAPTSACVRGAIVPGGTATGAREPAEERRMPDELRAVVDRRRCDHHGRNALCPPVPSLQQIKHTRHHHGGTHCR